MLNKRVLVTGGNGFLGTYCCQELADRGIPFLSVGLPPKPPTQAKPWENVHLDLTDESATEKLLNEYKPSHLLHLAWRVDHLDFWESMFNLDSMAATIRLFRQFENHGGKRFVSVGSCAEYDWTIGSPIKENHPLKPSTFYGLIKKQTFETLSFYSQRSGLSFSWARLFFLFGPGEPPGKLVPSVLSSLKQAQPVILRSADQTKKDFIYIKDAASALINILESNHNGAVNVGTGIGYSAQEVANLIQREFGKEDSISQPTIQNDGIVADISRLKSEFAYVPRYSLALALSDYLSELSRD